MHNGIIENHLALKAKLKARGPRLLVARPTPRSSRTSSPTSCSGGKDLPEAVRARHPSGEGHLRAGGGLARRTRTASSATKDSSPMVVGLSRGSELRGQRRAGAARAHPRHRLHGGGRPGGAHRRARVDIFDREGRAVNRPTRRIDWTPMMAEKGGHKHFMHKEIWEQPRALADTLRGRVLLSEGDVHFEGWNLAPEEVRRCREITILACGTSLALGAGRQDDDRERWRASRWRWSWRREFRYRDPIVEPGATGGGHQPVGRDAGHAVRRCREAKARGRPHGGAVQRGGQRDDPRGGPHRAHQRRAGDRRRLHEGLHHPARGAVPAGGEAGAAARDAGRGPGAGAPHPAHRDPEAGGGGASSARPR